MFKCKMAEFLFRYFPFPFWRNFLIRKHIDQCPHCQKHLVGREEAKKLLILEDNMEFKLDAWPDLLREIRHLEEKKQPFLQKRKKWKIGLAGALGILLTGILIFFSIDHKKSNQENGFPESFQLQYIKVQNQPAQSFLFQPKDSNMIFVWAEKKPQKES